MVDPELGINVVDLGLVYGVDVDAERIATIDMTLTSAACPLTDVIEEQAREALDGLGRRTSGSTGSGCRRGARRASPTTAASSSAPSASTSRTAKGSRPDVEGLGVGRDPGVDLVRLVLARERDVDRESEFRHGRHGPWTASRTSWCASWLAGSSRVTEMTRALALAGDRQPGRDACRAPGIG